MLTKNNRLNTISILEKLHGITLTDLIDKGHVARAKLTAIEDSEAALTNELDVLEMEIRDAFVSGNTISVHDYYLQQDFIETRRTILNSKVKQKEQAKKIVRQCRDDIKQAHLTSRGLNNVYERYLKIQNDELDRKEMIEIDELWLQNNGLTDE